MREPRMSHDCLVTVEPKSRARGRRARLDPAGLEARLGLEVSQRRDPIARAMARNSSAADALPSNRRSKAVAMTALVRIGSSSRLGPLASIRASVSVGP
jgi:hypothetical protein